MAETPAGHTAHNIQYAGNHIDALDRVDVGQDVVRYAESSGIHDRRYAGPRTLSRPSKSLIFKFLSEPSEAWTIGADYEGTPMASSPTAAPTVLVVEDEFLIRMNVVEIIEDAGFHALEAANADEAIALLETHPDISIMFTDIDMPGSMNGIRLAHAVRGRWPPIKIIATSGHFQLRDGDLPDKGRFLPKPYSSDQITTAIREVMAA